MPIEPHLIIAAFVDLHGFDPQGVYCQLTGKKIGSFSDSEFDMLVENIGVDSADEIEEAVDDIAMRVLASMRPSIRWNKLRENTLAEMRVSDPIGTLAYLTNRMFAPLNHRKIGIESLLGYYADRIKAYQLYESWGMTDATNTILYMLLELDAKWNLDTESPPFNAWDFFFDAPTMDHRVEMLQAWYERRCEAYDKKMKALETQSNWSRQGNVLAKPAFAAAFLESKPPSKTAVKKQAKAEELAFMQGLLSEIRMGRVETVEEGQAIAPKPSFVPIRKMPASFGVK